MTSRAGKTKQVLNSPPDCEHSYDQTKIVNHIFCSLRLCSRRFCVSGNLSASHLQMQS